MRFTLVSYQNKGQSPTRASRGCWNWVVTSISRFSLAMPEITSLSNPLGTAFHISLSLSFSEDGEGWFMNSKVCTKVKAYKCHYCLISGLLSHLLLGLYILRSHSTRATSHTYKCACIICGCTWVARAQLNSSQKFKKWVYGHRTDWPMQRVLYSWATFWIFQLSRKVTVFGRIC